MVRIIHLEATWEYHWGILNHFLKTCKIFRDMNLTGRSKYSGKGCSISQPPKMRDEMPISTIYQKPRYDPHYSKYIWVRVIYCAQGIYRVWALMQLLIHRASALALLEDEQKFKLGGGVDGHYFPFWPFWRAKRHVYKAFKPRIASWFDQMDR